MWSIGSVGRGGCQESDTEEEISTAVSVGGSPYRSERDVIGAMEETSCSILPENNSLSQHDVMMLGE